MDKFEKTAFGIIKEKICPGWKNKKIILTTLGSPFMDNQYVFPSLGILYLVSVAKSVGMKVKFIDSKTQVVGKSLISDYDICYTDEFDFDNLTKYRYFDVIGISCMTPQGQQAYQICRAIKKKYPKIRVILGGPHAKFYLNECKREKFDVIVAGDGERVFKELLLGETGSMMQKVSAKTTSDTLVLEDYISTLEMNEYPVPYRDPEYIKKYGYLLNGNTATTLVNSRGCPMSCAFCEDRRTKGRWYSVKHFTQEVERILSLGINGIMVFDDLFATTPSKLAPYLKVLEYYHKNHSLVFRCFGHANIIARNPGILDMLYQSGCVEIGFGAESASQKILDNVSKGVKIDEMHYCVEKTIEAGINIKAFFMIALPGESEKTFSETYNFIKKYRLKYPFAFDFDLAAFYPYKGTLIGNAMRLKNGKTASFRNKQIDSHYFNIRLRDDLSFEEIDNNDFGAYKKRGGDSDIVVETYDWLNKKVLLSADTIGKLKESAMTLSNRYTDGNGNRIFSPTMEGNIGNLTLNPGNVSTAKKVSIN